MAERHLSCASLLVLLATAMPMVAACSQNDTPSGTDTNLARNDRLIVQLQSNVLDQRLDALEQLEQTTDPVDYDTLAEYLSDGVDPDLHGRIGKLLASTDDPRFLPALGAARQRHQSPVVSEQLDLALARLGDADALSRIESRLSSTNSGELLETIRGYAYIDRPEALNSLAPLLRDPTPILNLRPSHAHTEYWLRRCDVAAEVIIEVLQPALSFDWPRTPRIRFTEAEIDEIGALLRGETGATP